MKHIGKPFLCFLLTLLLLLQSGCGQISGSPQPAEHTSAPALPAAVFTMERDYSQPTDALTARGGYHLAAAVLYSGDAAGYGVTSKLDYLRQSLVVNLSVEAVSADGAFSLTGFDFVCLDESLLSLPDPAPMAEAVMAFAAEGGGVLCPNGFYDVFPLAFFGAQSFSPVAGYPSTLYTPELPPELTQLQALVTDFQMAYGQYHDSAALKNRDYGMAMLPDTAQPLIYQWDAQQALYALNRYGRGLVLFTNPLLPNRYSASAFHLQEEEGQSAFADTTASFNQMYYSAFAALVSKQRYGFSLSREFGSYGSPSMSWELHYEDITAYEHNSIEQFSHLTEDAMQPISMTIVRSTYTWFEQAETMGYSLNGSSAGLDFALDRNESVYSSGTHIAAGEEWLKLGAIENAASYFADTPEENYRLFPCLLDHDGDGLLDAFCGSADGKLYYLRGLGFTGRDGRLCMEPAVEVPDVRVPAFSAPACADLDGDGLTDLLVGASDGKLYLFRGQGGLAFEQAGVWMDTEIRGQCLPRFGDCNGDGVTDLAVGSDQGVLLFYYGSADAGALRFSKGNMSAMSKQCADLGLGSWLSPELCDLNGDGVTDLAVGVYAGYVAMFHGDGSGRFAFAEWLTVDDWNYQGNNNLKFGTYCSPRFADLDGNGTLDLLCGYLEYGLAYPIDSPYFPCRTQLQEQIDLAKEKHWYVGMHYLCGSYYSADREDWELSAQRQALDTYGLTQLRGVNQHTWHLSVLDHSQSLRAMYRAGLLWQSGYEPSGAVSRSPHSAAENIVVLPFYLMDGDEPTLLVQNCSTLIHRDHTFTDLSGKYRMPMLAYYHCDRIYNGEDGAKNAVETVNTFRETFHYNFVKEDQLMLASAAASNLSLDVQPAGAGFTLTAQPVRTDLPLYDADYQAACGVRIDFCEAFSGWQTDADIAYTDGGSLFVGLNATVTVAPEAEAPALRLRQLNLPAGIARTGDGMTLTFRSDGLMEAVVYGQAETDSPGWTVTQRDGLTVFSKFGDCEVLHIIPIQ